MGAYCVKHEAYLVPRTILFANDEIRDTNDE